jgi:hypothetical protein
VLALSFGQKDIFPAPEINAPEPVAEAEYGCILSVPEVEA